MQAEGANIKEIGIGAALMITLLIIREVVTSLLKRNGNGSNKESNKAGDQDKAFWERRYDKIDSDNSKTHEILNDIKNSLMILIRWKGSGD